MTSYVERFKFTCRRFPKRAIRLRPGFTLPELTSSIFAFAVLLAGLLSVLQITAQALRLPQGTSAGSSRAFQAISRIQGDIQVAKRIYEQSPSAIEFSTDDRDGDGIDEVVRYEFQSSNGGEITRSVLFSNSATLVSESLLQDVAEFETAGTYRVNSLISPIQLRRSRESLLFSHDFPLNDLPSGNGNGNGLGNSLSIEQSSVLLVVRDESSLTRHESDIQKLFNDLNVTTILIQDSASLTDFDSQLTNVDMVYVSDSSVDSGLPGKIRSFEGGILAESSWMAEALGMAATTTATAEGAFLDVGLDSHVLFRPDVSGSLQVFSSPQVVNTLTDTAADQSPNLRIAGRNGNRITLAMLQPGDQAFLGPSSPISQLGNSDEYENESGGFTWHHVGTQFSTSDTVLANSISVFNRRSGSVALRFGIYSDNNGQPGSLIAQTNYTVQGTSSGPTWTTLDLENATSLSPGNYWIVASVASFGGSARFYYENGGSSRSCFSTAFPWFGMMTNWGTYQNYGYNVKLSMYVNSNLMFDAAGRRVFAPWSGTEVDLRKLTTAGEELFARVVRWCMTRQNPASETTFSISQDRSVCQYIHPDFVDDESRWQPGRISVFLKPLHSDGAGNIRFSVFEPDSNHHPGDVLLAQSEWIPVNSFGEDHFRWITIPIAHYPVLDTSNGICVVIESDSSSAGCLIMADQNAPYSQAALSYSINGGQSYTDSALNETLRIYLHGFSLKNH